MAETITVHDLDKPGLALPMDRDVFYAEQKAVFEKGKKPTQAVEVVHVLIFHEDGTLLIQQRSNQKAQNADLLDKSIGGHVRYGDQPDYTVMVETVQELQVPSITLRTEADFRKTYLLLRGYISSIPLIVWAAHCKENRQLCK